MIGRRAAAVVVASAVLGCSGVAQRVSQPPGPRIAGAAPSPSPKAAAPAPTVPAPTVPVAASPTAAAAPPTAVPTAQSAPELIDLALTKGEPALVSVPPGQATRPVVVVAHGAGGRASSHCALWQHIAATRAFILCPRGFRMYPPEANRFFYDGHHELAAEVERGLAALKARYGARIDVTAPYYAGYSQGAGMGAMMLPKHSATFAGAMLVEGGFGEMQEWNVRVAKQFRVAGGRRIALICGRRVCFEHARTTAGYLRRGGLEAKVIYAAGAGHTYGGAVYEAVKKTFEWLVEEDPRWAFPRELVQ